MVLIVVNFFKFPWCWAISLTNLEDIIWFSTSDIRNMVSTLSFNFLFMPANWNSYSKSDTALRPLKIRLDLYFLHNSVVKELKVMTLIFFFENFKSSNKAFSTVGELKIDGNALALSYSKGMLVSATTRGDGTAGELTLKIQSLYYDIVRGKKPEYDSWLSTIF